MPIPEFLFLRTRLAARLTGRPWWMCVAVLAAILVPAMTAGPSRAEEALGTAPRRIEAVLEGIPALSPQQMAAQTGEALPLAAPRPGLGQTSPPRVILWDEMRQGTALPPGSGSSVSLTVKIAQ